MEAITSFKTKYSDVALTVFRVVFGLAFLWHGLQKFGLLDGAFKVPGTPLIFVAGVIELVGGLFILLGLFTSWTAFVASGEMAAAYFIGHVASSGSIVPMTNKGEAALLYCFGFLLLFFLGGGKWALDAVVCKKK